MDIESHVIKIFVIAAAFLLFLLFVFSGLLFWENSNHTKSAEIVYDRESPAPLIGQNIEEGSEIKLLFFGDIMLDRNVGKIIKQNGFDYLFEKIKDADLLKNKDVIGANLEGAVTDSGSHYSPNVGYDFAFFPQTVEKLKNYGFNFFNLANNHILDQGQRGIDETRQNLDRLGFYYSGCVDGQIAECSIEIVEINPHTLQGVGIKNQKIGLAGFSSVYNNLDEEKIKKTISDLKAKSDFVIVNIHWGNEYQHNFSGHQQKLARIIIDAGADIVIGHHPHVVQGLEIYQGRPIFYSLGNFIFDQYFSKDTQEGLALELEISGQNLNIKLTPLASKQSQVYMMDSDLAARFFQKISGWSQLEKNIEEQILSGSLILAR